MADGSDTSLKTARSSLGRNQDRGHHDLEAVHDILDAGFVCHIGLVTDHGPVVFPTTYGRDGEVIHIHGSPAARWLRTAGGGAEICLTVTHVDGLVLGRSAMHHSINYRSVMVFGTARELTDPAEKLVALEHFVDHVVPGRWDEVRPPTPQELAATIVLELAITEASAKVRTGPPHDEPADLDLDVWAGELPLSLVAGTPTAAPDLDDGVAVSPSVADWST